MKLWKLVSVLEGDVQQAMRIASTNKQWIEFEGWLRDFSRLVNVQDRGKLDFDLPDEFVRQCMQPLSLCFYVSKGTYIRSRRAFMEDEKISAIDAFDRYGGDALEEALESGSFKI